MENAAATMKTSKAEATAKSKARAQQKRTAAKSAK
jgi:hypothetical protein